MNKLDGKYYGEIRKVADDQIVPAEEWILFRAKDDAVPAMLREYRRICQRMGSDREHLDGIEALIRRTEAWRHSHPDECKVPDSEPNEPHDQKATR